MNFSYVVECRYNTPNISGVACQYFLIDDAVLDGGTYSRVQNKYVSVQSGICDKNGKMIQPESVVVKQCKDRHEQSLIGRHPDAISINSDTFFKVLSAFGNIVTYE